MNPYQQRRQLLSQQLDQNSVAIIVGNKEQIRNLNIKFPFKQDNDFYYLTGFNEPDCVAVIRPGHVQPYVIFARDLDQEMEVRFGFRAGLKGLKTNHQVDESYPIEQFESLIVELFEQRTNIFISDNHGVYQANLYHWLSASARDAKFDSIKAHRSIHQLSPLLTQMRVIKDHHEIALIKHAVDASVAGHIATMQASRVGINEGQLSATFNRTISDFGCNEVGYPNIVACGDNAICLHYEDNNSDCDDNKLLLADMGGEYQHYTADITRTFPINGKFTPPQATIYNLVLKSLDAAIAQVKPGAHWNSLYETAMAVLAQGLLDLGILRGSFEQVMADESYLAFTVHKTGHWMGLHVHDVGAYHDQDGAWVKLTPKMVFTIEPGIYIPSDCLAVEPQWRGIAVRIEDDILVTDTGYQNLSIKAPRTINDIEQIMQD